MTNEIYNFMTAIRIVDIIRFRNPAIMSPVASFSFLVTPMIAERAKGNTMLAVMTFI
jgi:hypothetical protein